MIKKLKNLAKFDPNRDAQSNWNTADELYFGWFAYSPFEMQERYRDSGRNEHASKSLEYEMRLDIRGRMALGEIIAFGVQICPQLKSKAEQIPQIMFQSHEVAIDWQTGEICGLGRTFNDVRICLSAGVNTAPKKGTALAAANSNRGGGRPSQYPKIREVLQELFTAEPAYQRLSGSRLLDIVNERYVAKFALPGVPLAPVSERTLREHLKRYRQELAGTGNN